MATRDPDELITADELAAWLRVPVDRVYRWNHTGDGPPVLKAGRSVRYRVGDVLEWMTAGAARTSA